ncbi:glycosyltransferase family 39 protein [Hydrogenophaga sp. H7]|uniref:ArnT family glycosyltransferase n=1 Tax=Hydrogenophaga sp. H7 TaxID=1882399 RepID=UPI00117BD048|nr:hypothetical protein [Hydrogenophaga sp. H7]
MLTPSLTEAQSPGWTRRAWGLIWALLALLILTAALKGRTPDTEWVPFSDQSSHLMATMSLWHDHDLRYTLEDLERFNAQFPAARGPRGMFLKQSSDGAIYFAKPALYAVFNAPFYGAFGTTGFIIFNLMAIAIMAALTHQIARRIYGYTLSHLMTAALFLMGPFMAWTMVVHPDLFIALLLYTGGYLALTQNRSSGWWAAGLLLGMALAEKPTFVVALPFLLLCVPGPKFRTYGWIVFGLLAGWLIPTLVNLSQDGNLLAYQGIRFYVGEPPFPLEAGWTSPKTGGFGHIFDTSFLLRAMTGNLALVPTIVFEFIFGRQTGMLLYFPVALVFLFTALTRRNINALLICIGLFAYLLLYALAFPSNGFGGGASYGSRYLMQALPLLMLALLPLIKSTPPAGRLVPSQLLGVSAVLASLVFQHGTLPPSGKLVQNPTTFLLNTPATLFPLEDRLLPWIPIFTSHFRVDNTTAEASLFSKDATWLDKYVDGKIVRQLTLYQHNADQALPALYIHSSVHARVDIKNGGTPIWTGSISPQKVLDLPLDQSFFQHEAFDLLDKKTKRWGAFSIELQSVATAEKPAYASFELTTDSAPVPIPFDRIISIHEFNQHGIIPRFHWSYMEEWGQWTDGEYAELLIPLPDNLPDGTEIQITATAFLARNQPRQSIEVFLNGEKQYDHTFSSPGPITLQVPVGQLVKRNAVSIGFRMRNPTTPLAQGISQDDRKLGLGLHNLMFTRRSATSAGTP